MKKFFISLLALMLCLSVVPSCEKPEEPEGPGTEQETPGNDDPETPGNEDPENPGNEDPENPGNEEPEPEPTAPVVTWSVTATLPEALVDCFTWEAEDALTAWYVNAAGEYGYNGFSERDVVATEVNGATAKYTYTTLPQGGKTWLAYKSNTGYDGCSARKVEFNHSSAYTQPSAGVLPREMVKLLSAAVEVPVYEGEEDATVDLAAQMNLAGAILKNVVTSSNGTYAEENVLSVQYVSNTENICGTTSAYAYNMLEEGKYWMNNDGNSFGDECKLIWDGTSKSVKTTVTEPAAVSEGLAVYMPVPPVHVGAYRVIVETDQAMYTFDYSAEDLTFADGEIMNMSLDLDAENVNRLGNDEMLGELRYEGSIGQNSTHNVVPEGGKTGIGYWYAQTRDSGTDNWVTREHNVPENVPFYSGVVFTAIDDATGAAADWLTVEYRANDTWWDCTTQPNESAEERSATVTATFADAMRYALVADCYTRTIKVVQAGAGAPKVVDYASIGLQNNVSLQKDAYNGLDVGYCLLKVNGVEERNWNHVYKDVTFKCVSKEDSDAGNYDNVVDWLTCSYQKNANGDITDCRWEISATENTTGAPRTAVVVAVFPEYENYEFPANPSKVVVTQEAEDNTVYDPASAANMWNSMTVEEMFCFYAPGWSPIYESAKSGSLQEGELFAADGNNYTFTMNSATWERWQAQFAFRTDMSSSASKTYDFYCVLNSTTDVAAALVKLVQTGADGNFYFELPVKLVAGQDIIVKKPNMAGMAMDKISLFFDFGGNPENTVVNIKDIIFQEHQE